MERFCDKCGTLVSGDGGFCPSCGAPMSSAFGSTGQQGGGVDLSKQGSMPSTADAMPYPTVPTPTPTGNTYQGQSNYGQPNYGQPIYPQNNYMQNNYMQNREMTLGQWMLTIFLSGLGIIGIILLFVWGFSADTPTSKKNYARAMLIFQGIALVLSFLFIPVFMGVIYSIAEEFEDPMYSSILPNLFSMFSGMN